jgi:hypothetical protein
MKEVKKTYFLENLCAMRAELRTPRLDRGHEEDQ